MVCKIEIYEKPRLNNPVLIEGLPGIGFIANIAALHLIQELKAKRFAEISSGSFQDLTVTTEAGGMRSPTNELYYCNAVDGGRDLIIWYGNTQALTTFGQYELCGKVLDTVEQFGCRSLITLGGYRKDEIKATPELYCAATDPETVSAALSLGAKLMVGQIFGVAGLSVGLGRLRGFKGFALLVETLGTYPDANATRLALSVLNRYLSMKVDLSKLDEAAEKTTMVLESFGLISSAAVEKKKEEQKFRWFV
jgi:uncharacterized protein (TIGR00162 family)